MTQDRARQMLRAARASNRERNMMDRAVGFPVPEDGPPDVLLRTAMSAVWAGLVEEDLECMAVGYALLGELHQMVIGKDYDADGGPP